MRVAAGATTPLAKIAPGSLGQTVLSLGQLSAPTILLSISKEQRTLNNIGHISEFEFRLTIVKRNSFPLLLPLIKDDILQ